MLREQRNDPAPWVAGGCGFFPSNPCRGAKSTGNQLCRFGKLRVSARRPRTGFEPGRCASVAPANSSFPFLKQCRPVPSSYDRLLQSGTGCQLWPAFEVVHSEGAQQQGTEDRAMRRFTGRPRAPPSESGWYRNRFAPGHSVVCGAGAVDRDGTHRGSRLTFLNRASLLVL